MLDRDLKLIAIQMAALLPDDKKSSRKVHGCLGELIEHYLFEENCQAFLRDATDSESNITRLPGKDAKSSR